MSNEPTKKERRKIAIKIVDVFGNEHMTVFEIDRYPDPDSELVVYSKTESTNQ